MSEKVIYISDLDGTLLRDDASLSSYSKHCLNGMIADGLQFTVASARSVVSMRPILKGLEIQLPIIELNGAFISDLKTGHHEVINEINRETVEAIYQLIDDRGCVPYISTYNGQQDCLYFTEIANEGMDWYYKSLVAHNDSRLRKIENISDSFDDDVVCITTIGKREVMLELAHAIEEDFDQMVEMHCLENVYSPGWYWLTLQDREASKDKGIQKVLRNGREDIQELVTFGDSANDLKMFKLSDRAIAVANGSDELKSHASHIIGTNEEDSVVKYIADDWPGYDNQPAENSTPKVVL